MQTKKVTKKRRIPKRISLPEILQLAQQAYDQDGVLPFGFSEVTSERGRIQQPSLTGDALAEFIVRELAVSREESRYTLNGALLGIDADKLYMVATDGHWMAYVEKAERIEVKDTTTLVVPKSALADVYNLLSMTDETEVTFAKDVCWR